MPAEKLKNINEISNLNQIQEYINEVYLNNQKTNSIIKTKTYVESLLEKKNIEKSIAEIFISVLLICKENNIKLYDAFKITEMLNVLKFF